MGYSFRIKTLATAVGVALATTGVSYFAADSATAKTLVSVQAANDVHSYLVRFAEPGLLHYKGGTQGIQATAPSATGQRKLDVASAAAQAYAALLDGQREAHLNEIAQTLGRTLQVTHTYGITMNGAAIELTRGEAQRVARLPGVVGVRAAGVQHLDTYAGPKFIKANEIWDGTAVPGGTGSKGAGIVVGVVDSGANSDHPSFADDAACGFDGSNHKLLSAVDCSASSGGLCSGPNPEANDGNGHGVHTASTAAGNTLTGAAVPPPTIPPPFTEMSGVAPCASLRTYKVCETNTCAGAAIQAGIENAIADGVDVINFSISGGDDPWNDGDSLFLDALHDDIFVAASAGNTRAETPNPVGEVNHLGPWVATVAASTHDYNISGSGLLSAVGPGTPPANTQNIALTPGSGLDPGTAASGLEIAFSTANPSGCTATGGLSGLTGKVALIERGGCNFSEKIQNADDAGAVLAVIYNNTGGSISMNVADATLPAYSILQSEGQAFVNFINASGATPVTVDFEPAVAQADVLGDFSLRGPSALTSVTKPDITGPGINIYAAVDDATTGGYGYLSGTSMSSPHLAGAGALIRSVQPDWTPAEVKSAIMLTAFTDGTKEDRTTPWDPDDVGSGRVDLSKAALAGFVLNETYDNFLAADPASSGDPKTLNIASARNMDCADSCDWTRTLRNTLSTPSSWSVTVNAPEGLDVSVDTPSFSFDGSATATQEITITATPTAELTDVTFAEVVFHEANGLAPDAHLYVAVKGGGGGEPDDEIFKDGFDGESGATGFSENFDAYQAGSNVHGQGGWKGWANDETAGATVVDAQSVSAPNSIEIEGASDLIHEFSGYTSGSYTITAKQYIPDDFAGQSYFLFENAYSDTDTSIISWSTQVYFDSSTGTVGTEDGAADPGSASYVTGQWVDLRLEVDLDQDLQTFYYNGTELYSGSWTQQFPDQEVEGIPNIGSIDLYANGATAVYYDDIQITPNP